METIVPKDVQEMLKQSKLDAIKKQLAETKYSNLKDAKPLLILTPTYSGSRVNWFSYHPLKCANIDKAFDFAKKNFMADLRAWYDVVELYTDEMPLSERIFSSSFKKEIDKILAEVDKARDPYLVESLAEMIWSKEGSDLNDEGKYDKSEKTSQHDTSTMSELKRRAEELKHEDLGVKVDKQITEQDLIQHSWGG